MFRRRDDDLADMASSLHQAESIGYALTAEDAIGERRELSAGKELDQFTEEPLRQLPLLDD